MADGLLQLAEVTTGFGTRFIGAVVPLPDGCRPPADARRLVIDRSGARRWAAQDQIRPIEGASHLATSTQLAAWQQARMEVSDG